MNYIPYTIHIKNVEFIFHWYPAYEEMTLEDIIYEEQSDEYEDAIREKDVKHLEEEAWEKVYEKHWGF